MNIFKRIYCRAFQSVMYVATFVLDFREPKMYSGSGTVTKVANILTERKLTSVLVVTDDTLYKLGLLNNMLKALDEAKINYAVYHDTVPNPTIDNIEAALVMYKENKSQAIIAFGGGSSMDCAKGVGMRVSNPTKTIQKMRGLLKVRHKTPLIIAVPTTAGTGSEATLAAVVVDSLTHEKYAINDPHLIPSYAVLDPELIINLPSKITSTTGMDALTHAVEAYIGHSNTKKTKMMAKAAVKLIFTNLEESYNNPTNLVAREKMQRAAYYAGVAFTRAYVGYVHAIAHTLGGFYGVPHGLANAVILPYVLDAFGKSAERKLAELADCVNLTDNKLSNGEKAKAFITAIRDMNKRMGIPEKFVDIIKEEDIPLMVKRADREGNPLYPVPKEMDKNELEKIFKIIRN